MAAGRRCLLGYCATMQAEHGIRGHHQVRLRNTARCDKGLVCSGVGHARCTRRVSRHWRVPRTSQTTAGNNALDTDHIPLNAEASQACSPSHLLVPHDRRGAPPGYCIPAIRPIRGVSDVFLCPCFLLITQHSRNAQLPLVAMRGNSDSQCSHSRGSLTSIEGQ